MKIRTCGLVAFLLPITTLYASDYDVVRASYGSYGHLAGTGQLEDTNGWLPSMEGAQALEVELSNTHMTMADAQRNLYLVEKESHAVIKIAPDGTVHTVVGTHVAGNGSDAPQPGTSVALSNPNGLYVLPDGTVYILDRDNNKIRRLATNGVVSTVVTNALSLGAGRGLWVSSSEDTIFYTASSVVRKWKASEGVTLFASGFSNLGNIDVDPTDGTLVVTDRGAHRVYRVFSDGTREVIAGDGTTSDEGDGGPATQAGLNQVRGIAFLPHGGYFLATHRGGDIWYVDTDQVAHKFIEGEGSSSTLPYTSVCEPRAVSIAPWGDLIITENDHGVIRIVPRVEAIADVGALSSPGIQMTWYSMPSLGYEIDVAENLAPVTWTPLTSVTGQASNIVTTYEHTNGLGGACQFYRIHALGVTDQHSTIGINAEQ